MRVIRDGTPVVDSEPVIVDDGLVVRDHVVVGVCERPGVDEAEMGDIKKPFELAAGERGYVERRAVVAGSSRASWCGRRHVQTRP